jgi:phospholipid/cholesterol/gamma-HCH transport system substrate-binding protein
MLKISNEVKVAVLAIIAVALGFWGFKFLKGINVLTASKTYYVKYSNVDQLRPSSPVFINGFQVGMVKDMYLDKADDKTVIVVLNIDRGVDIPKDAVATIIGLTLMGGKAVEIIIKSPCNGDCAESGTYLNADSKSFLSSVIGDPSQIDAYTDRLRAGLTINIDSLAKVHPEGVAASVDALDNSLKNLERMTIHLNQILELNKKSIGVITSNFASISGTIKSNDKNISEAIENLSELSKQLKNAGIDKTSQKAALALDSITYSLSTLRTTLTATTQTINRVDNLAQKMAAGEGLVGKTLTDEELYNNLVSTSRHLHLLLQDIRMHPERYTRVKVKLFGKNKPPKYANPLDDAAYQMLVDSMEREYSKKLKN